jgi:hypothetical protein
MVLGLAGGDLNIILMKNVVLINSHNCWTFCEIVSKFHKIYIKGVAFK